MAKIYFGVPLVLGAAISQFLFLLATFSMMTEAKAQTPSVDQLQAAFVFQFANYVTWAPSDVRKEFVITVVGRNDALVQELNRLSESKKVQVKNVRVTTAESSSAIKSSDIILMTSNRIEVLRAVLAKSKGSGALVVSFAPDFAKHGAMINFFFEESRLKFEINQEALKREGLQAASQLLNLAKLVKDEG